MITIVVDGIVDQNTSKKIKAKFSSIEFSSIYDLINPSLVTYPSLNNFLEFHRLGPKLLMILSLQLKEEFIYSDSDVLAFNRTSDLIDAISIGQSVFNQESNGSCYDEMIVQEAERLHTPLLSHFNSGLIYCTRLSLDISLADRLAHVKSSETCSWFDEQTILAVLLAKARAIALPSEQYVISNYGQFYYETDLNPDLISARHFTGPVRHRMYGSGYNYLLGLL
jgi:hypothetical protein